MRYPKRDNLYLKYSSHIKSSSKKELSSKTVRRILVENLSDAFHLFESIWGEYVLEEYVLTTSQTIFKAIITFGEQYSFLNYKQQADLSMLNDQDILTSMCNKRKCFPHPFVQVRKLNGFLFYRIFYSKSKIFMKS